MYRKLPFAALSLILTGCLGAPPSGGSQSTPFAAPSPNATPVAASDELIKFGRCMTQADWTSSGMDKLPDQMTDSGVCRGCHQGGTFAVYLSSDPAQNFQHMQVVPFLYKFAELATNPDGTFIDIVPANRFSQRGQEVTLGHPTFTLAPLVQQALQQFFTLTHTRFAAGGCP